MAHFCCPVCGGRLTDDEKTRSCKRGHRFDKARGGYVNLLCSQASKAKRHGDDKRMLLARRAFLDSGAYAPLCERLCETVRAHLGKGGVLLDAGCGEGYYTAALQQSCPNAALLGVDISKDAVHMTAARAKGAELAVASLFSLPLAENSCDGVVSVFAPCADAEFARVLKKGGVLVRVIPTERHLFGLKAAIYEVPRLNKPEKTEVAGFALRHREEIAWTLRLQTADEIRHLFEMTPYFYKTGKDDQERLLSRAYLETEVAFAIVTYEKL